MGWVCQGKGEGRKEVAGEAGPAELVVHFGALPPNRYMRDQLTWPFLQGKKALSQVHLE